MSAGASKSIPHVATVLVGEVVIARIEAAAAGQVVLESSIGTGLGAGGRLDAVLAVEAALGTAALHELGPLPLLCVVDDDSERGLRRSLRAGARGVLVADNLEVTLVPAIHAVLAGLTCLPYQRGGAAFRPVLTTREKQVMGMVVLGMSNAEIARRLFVVETTIKSHLAAVFAKLGVRGRNEATAAILDPDRGYGTGILRITPPEEPVVATASRRAVNAPGSDPTTGGC